jgi:hypothetical protein
LIRSLLKSLLVLAVFVPVAAFLPLCAFRLCRYPNGVVVLFFIGPWSAAFWVLIYSQLSACKFWLGAQHVRQWREEHGGLLHQSFIATGWMFSALFASYGAELLLVWFTRSPAWLPAATYSPLAFAWVWRQFHG